MSQFSQIYTDFLEFETTHFDKEYPVVAYDPFMIRYSEYRFVLENLALQPNDTLLDLGCGYNIFPLFTASKHVKTIGLDSDSGNWRKLKKRLKSVERNIGRSLPFDFQVGDATDPPLENESVDKVSAVSAIEHMFTDAGDGDRLALSGIARVLKPGGIACITLPTSNGNPFHEARHGDKNFPHAYRLYTPEAIAERILSHPQLTLVKWEYIAHRTPDPRFEERSFFNWWMGSLKHKERWKWAWLNPIMADVFNPIVSKEDGESDLLAANTALLCVQKT